MTASGLPSEALIYLSSEIGGSPYVTGAGRMASRASAPPSPTTVLVTLAAAGRNPTDITLPTVGSEASGDDDEDDEDMVSSTSVTTSSASSAGTTSSTSSV